jgi:hypothetical protein
MPVTETRGPGEIRETEATGKIKSVYDDIMASLRVPFVDLAFRVLAQQPDFLEIAWQQLKPNVTTVYFEEQADEIRSRAVDATAGLGAPPRPEPAAADALKVFHYADAKLLLAICGLRAAVSGQYPALQTLLAAQKRQIPPGIPVSAGAIDEIEPGGADERVALIFDDIKATLNVDIVDSDYRALALWPDYLAWAWQTLKPLMASAEYGSLQLGLRRTAESAITAFPFRLELSPQTLRLCGMADRDVDDVRSTLDNFCERLSGRVANAAFLSVGVNGQYGARRSPFPVTAGGS